MRPQITAHHIRALEDESTYNGLFLRLALTHQPQLPSERHKIMNLWSGSGIVADDFGMEWMGVGGLGRIAGLQTTSKLKIGEIQFTLSGIPQEEIIDVDLQVRGFLATVWAAVINRDRMIVGGAQYGYINIERMVMSHIETKYEEDGRASLILYTNGGLKDLNTPTKIAWTSEEQKHIHPTDIGFDEIPKMIDRNVKWIQGPKRNLETEEN